MFALEGFRRIGIGDRTPHIQEDIPEAQYLKNEVSGIRPSILSVGIKFADELNELGSNANHAEDFKRDRP